MDGYLTLEEIQAAHTERKSHEGDSEIDREAIRQCVADNLETELPDKMTVEEHFDTVDTNSDGFIDFDEYSASKMAASEERFNLTDTSMDGEISIEELTAAFANRKEVREAHKTCREEQEIANSI